MGWTGLDQYDEGNPVGQEFLDRYEASATAGGRSTASPVVNRDIATVLLHAFADAHPLSPRGVKEALERVKMVPAASGAPGTRVSFGKWTRRGWMGAGYLVARPLDPDGVTLAPRRPLRRGGLSTMTHASSCDDTAVAESAGAKRRGGRGVVARRRGRPRGRRLPRCAAGAVAAARRATRRSTGAPRPVESCSGSTTGSCCIRSGPHRHDGHAGRRLRDRRGGAIPAHPILLMVLAYDAASSGRTRS